LAAKLCPDPLGAFSVPPANLAGFSGKGRGQKGKRSMGKEGKEGKEGN